MRFQYRVTWRRRDWSPTSRPKTRAFANLPAALAFIDDKLRGGDRPDLSGFDVLELHRRPVGRWEPVEVPE